MKNFVKLVLISILLVGVVSVRPLLPRRQPQKHAPKPQMLESMRRMRMRV